MKKRIVCIIFAYLYIGSICAQNSSTSSMEQIGTSMANFLKIGVGAREVAMGGATVADCDNITALYWNVGALDRLKNNEVIIQQTRWLVDTDLYFLGAGFKVSGLGTFGISLNYFSSGDISETTLIFPEGTGRNFNTYDLSAGLSFARNITESFSAGITVKYIQEGLDRERASTVAVDIGSVFETNFLNNLRIGMSLSNLGGRMKLAGSDLTVQYSVNPNFPTKVTTADLSTEEWDIPLFFRLGVATDVIQDEEIRWTIASEVMDSRDYIYRFSVGTEVGYYEKYFIRGGYKFMYDEESLTLGAGINIDLDWAWVRLDYAYASFGVFDNTQRFSLTFAY